MTKVHGIRLTLPVFAGLLVLTLFWLVRKLDHPADHEPSKSLGSSPTSGPPHELPSETAKPDPVISTVEGDSVTCRTSVCRARFDPALVSLELVTLPLKLRFRSMTVGGSTVTGPGAVSPEEGLPGQVSYHRAGVTERYTLGPEGVEQDFVVEELPTRAEITVLMEVESGLNAPPTGARGPSLLFRNKEGDFVQVSRAVAVDAGGRRLPLALAWTGTSVSMTVPADWVAEARLPIVIDPAYTWVRGFAPYNVGFDIAPHPPADAWVSVYGTQETGTSGGDIVLEQFDSLGTLVPQGGVAVSTDPAQEYRPQFCYAPEVNRYLVVWVKKGTPDVVMGRVMDGNLAPVTAAFPIGNNAIFQVMDCPVPAWDGTQWFVTWNDPTTCNVIGRFISSAGVPGVTIVPKTTGSSTISPPSAAFSNGVWAIIWNEGGFIAGRTFTPAGVFLTPPTTLIPTSSMDGSLVPGGGGFLFLWNTQTDTRARALSTSLTFTGPETVLSGLDQTFPYLSTMLGQGPRGVYLSATNEWYVLFSEIIWWTQGPGFNSYSSFLRGRRVNASGLLSPADTLNVGDVGYVTTIRLALNPTLNKLAVAFGQGPTAALKIIDVSLPTGISGLTAVPGDGKISLSWNAFPGASGYHVRRSTTPGGPYQAVASYLGATSFTDTGLTNGVTYSYLVTANFLGQECLPAEVAATPVAAGVLFIVGAVPPTGADAAVQSHLTSLGYTVTAVTGPACTTAQATGKALVVISSTITAADVNTKFRTVTTPVLLWESGIMNSMGMTGATSGTNFGTTTNQTQVAIVNPGHPAAGGQTGTVTVTSTAGPFTWGVPSANAYRIATLSGNAGRATIFCHDTGSVMTGLVAPGRRVGFFMGDATFSSLTPAGMALFDAAVKWAAGTVTSVTQMSALQAAPLSAQATPMSVPLTVSSATNLQSTFDAAVPGATITLPSGTFQVPGGARLKAGVSLRGAGPHLTVLDGAGAATVLSITGSGTDGRSIIEGLTLTNGSTGLDAGSADLLLRNVQIVRLSGDGVLVGNLGAVEGVSLTIADNGGAGIRSQSGQLSLRGGIVAGNRGAGVVAPQGSLIAFTSVLSNGGKALDGGITAGDGVLLQGQIEFQNAAGLDYRELPGSTSINAGDPRDGYRQEPQPNGGRINQGAFGDTPFATP